MATLSDDRAQLLLAGAFVFAVALLGLTIVFSAGNYTASLAGDAGTVSQGEDALTARASFAAALRSHVRVVNGKDARTFNQKRDALEAVVPAVGERIQEIYARQGRIVIVRDPTTVRRGTRIKQVSDENFREPDERYGGSPAETWELTNGGRVRNMTFHFSQLPPDFQDPFTLQFRQTSGTGNEWNVKIKRDVSGWEVTVERTDGSYTGRCVRPTSTGDEKTLDITEAEMDGRYCAPLDALEMDSTDYRVVVKTPNPNDATRTPAEGKFWLITTYTDAGAETTDPGDSVETDQSVIYSATVPFAYQSPAVEFESAVTVAPGEIP